MSNLYQGNAGSPNARDVDRKTFFCSPTKTDWREPVPAPPVPTLAQLLAARVDEIDATAYDLTEELNAIKRLQAVIWNQ